MRSAQASFASHDRIPRHFLSLSRSPQAELNARPQDRPSTRRNLISVSTSRLEAFSDGVIAVAITLLVLNLAVPQPGKAQLSHALATRWPSYAAYVVSFATIGIIWVNHHALLSNVVAVSRLQRDAPMPRCRQAGDGRYGCGLLPEAWPTCW